MGCIEVVGPNEGGGIGSEPDWPPARPRTDQLMFPPLVHLCDAPRDDPPVNAHPFIFELPPYRFC